MPTYYQLLIGLVAGAIPLIYLWISGKRMHEAERRRSKSPFSEKLLRPAGESIRLKLMEIEEEFMNHAYIMIAVIIIPAVMIIQTPMRTFSGAMVLYLTIPGAGWAVALWQWKKIRKLREKLRNYRLGYDGERYIAAELNPLLAKGYRVFHDFIFDMDPGGEATDFNIDHVVVGPTGIFAVETKAWRKPEGEVVAGHENHQLKIDGNIIRLPQGKQRQKPFIQAQHQADRLSKWLTGRSETKIPVRPLLVFPGWWIDNHDGGPVPVRSGKNCAHFFDMQPASEISKRELELLADRIEAQCRNLDS